MCPLQSSGPPVEPQKTIRERILTRFGNKLITRYVPFTLAAVGLGCYMAYHNLPETQNVKSGKLAKNVSWMVSWLDEGL